VVGTLERGQDGTLFANDVAGTGESYSLSGTPENPRGSWLLAQCVFAGEVASFYHILSVLLRGGWQILQGFGH
jgi:hypothetical protein